MLCFACKVQWNDHPKCIFSYSGSILAEFGAATIFFSFACATVSFSFAHFYNNKF